MEDLFTRYRTYDPETSREAVESISDKLGAIQAQVLDAFRDAGSGGLTDYELAALFPFAGQSTYRTRRSELVAKGLIKDTGRRATLGSGRRHIVWALTECCA